MKDMKLCIDPGHGMANRKPGVYDSGAIGGGVAEADIALQVALTIKHVAKLGGIETFLTRTDDTTPCPVGHRESLAEKQGCTHFLSLHCNAGPIIANGTETYYRDSRDELFADFVQDAALEAWGFKDRGIKHESKSQHSKLAIFDFNGPAALLEMGFISNPGNRKALLDRDARIRFARELLEAFR